MRVLLIDKDGTFRYTERADVRTHHIRVEHVFGEPLLADEQYIPVERIEHHYELCDCPATGGLHYHER